MTNTSRIAKNTLFLYFRQLLIMLVSLYTVRVVLATLGAEDYGIYNVVAGVVVMFGFLSGAMATASQRYFSVDLGIGDNRHLGITFSVTFQIYILIAAIIVVLAETLGLWFVNHRLVIPEKRIAAANWIYQAAVASFLLTLITAPYMAAIIAHENMKVYAYASIIEAVLKLGVVFFLRVLPFDKLSLYGVLLVVVSLVNTGGYRLYCRRNYEECRLRFVKDRGLFKEIIGYSGWNLFGSAASIIRNHGMTILLNLFFGPIVNAARAIAVQVNAAMISFAQNFSTALRPQIIKSYAAGEKYRMLRMVLYGTKVVYFLMLVITIPVLLGADFLLSLWLKNVPEHTVRFVQLSLVDVLIDSISYPLMAVVQATGKIKLYQTVVGGLLIMNLPVSYLFLWLGFCSETVFLVAIFLSLCALVLRILITQRQIKYSLLLPFARLLVQFLFFTTVSVSVPVLLWKSLNETLVQFCFFSLISILWTGGSLFIFGLRKEEKDLIVEKLIRRGA